LFIEIEVGEKLCIQLVGRTMNKIIECLFKKSFLK